MSDTVEQPEEQGRSAVIAGILDLAFQRASAQPSQSLIDDEQVSEKLA